VNVAFGHRFDSGFAPELQTGYYNADYSVGTQISGVAVEAGGNLDLVPVFVNGSFELRMLGPLSLELGGGAGMVYHSVDISATARGFGRQVTIRDSDSGWQFGLQGMAGLNLALGPNLALKAGYRLLYVTDDAATGHLLSGGLTFKF
jgi:opacity protein-like surface antigen